MSSNENTKLRKRGMSDLSVTNQSNDIVTRNRSNSEVNIKPPNNPVQSSKIDTIQLPLFDLNSIKKDSKQTSNKDSKKDSNKDSKQTLNKSSKQTSNKSSKQSSESEIDSDNDFIVNDSEDIDSIDSEDDESYVPRSKRRRLNSDFQKKCDIYNLPDNLPNLNSQTDKYEKVKKNLMESQIDLSTILSLDNVLDSELTQMVEKYSLMINSENDLSTYIKIRNELKDMIGYYANSDMKQRKTNMDKKTELDSIAINTSELENKILNMFSGLNMSDPSQKKHYLYIQGLIYQKYKKLSNMSPADSEYYKLKEWLDTAVNIPFNITSPVIKKDNLSQMLAKIKQGLDAELFGMEKVKEELLMAINQRFTNPSKADTSIALVGPPGVGKTKIITVLAKIMSYPWEHISMGGTNDSSFLAGHSYTYEGAKPGQLVNALIRMKCKDGIIFFDEIDKIADTSNGKEVSNQLLHITDFTQNDHFCDKYMPEIPIDLSKIWFIFSLNSIAAIDPVLSNRFNFIYVEGYTAEEKLTICRDHLLPKAFDKYKLSVDKYIFTDQILRKIINHSIQREKSANSDINTIQTKTGIRELKRSIDHIFNRLSLLENMINNKLSNSNIVESLSFYPKDMEFKNMLKLKITEDLIDNFLT